ncbi:MAG: heavy metal translocating P-type ATPase, partial [Nitrospiraceae bacterium]
MLEVPEQQAIFDTVGGQDKVFCCHGCRGIYRLINEEGLEEFYTRREGWIPGPPEHGAVETSAFREAVRQTGQEMETDIMFGGIRCASCIWLIEKILLRTQGVTSVRANFATHTARVRWDPAETGLGDIVQRIRSAGYTPKPHAAGGTEEALMREQRGLLIRLGTAAFFSMQLMLYSVAMYAGYFQGIGWQEKMVFQVLALVLTTPVVFYSGMPFLRGTAGSLKSGVLNMDVLVATGAGSAYFY